MSEDPSILTPVEEAIRRVRRDAATAGAGRRGGLRAGVLRPLGYGRRQLPPGSD